jgi:hypothetical protein
MIKEPPIWKKFCVPRGLIPRRTTFKFEYLREFEPEFENVLGYELGAHMGSIHEKTRGQKSRATVPGKARGSAGWRICKVLDNLTKARALFHQLPLKARALNGPGYIPGFYKSAYFWRQSWRDGVLGGGGLSLLCQVKFILTVKKHHRSMREILHRNPINQRKLSRQLTVPCIKSAYGSFTSLQFFAHSQIVNNMFSQGKFSLKNSSEGWRVCVLPSRPSIGLNIINSNKNIG